MKTATGFDFEPLANGHVLIEFFGDDGDTLNTQEVTAEVIRHMPLISALTDAALLKGPGVAQAVFNLLGGAARTPRDARKG